MAWLLLQDVHNVMYRTAVTPASSTPQRRIDRVDRFIVFLVRSKFTHNKGKEHFFPYFYEILKKLLFCIKLCGEFSTFQ